jgi:hypothetical protein
MVAVLNKADIKEAHDMTDVWIDLWYGSMNETPFVFYNTNDPRDHPYRPTYACMEDVHRDVFPSTGTLPRMGSRHMAMCPWQYGFGNANWIEGGSWSFNDMQEAAL